MIQREHVTNTLERNKRTICHLGKTTYSTEAISSHTSPLVAIGCRPENKISFQSGCSLPTHTSPGLKKRGWLRETWFWFGVFDSLAHNCPHLEPKDSEARGITASFFENIQPAAGSSVMTGRHVQRWRDCSRNVTPYMTRTSLDISLSSTFPHEGTLRVQTALSCYVLKTKSSGPRMILAAGFRVQTNWAKLTQSAVVC